MTLPQLPSGMSWPERPAALSVQVSRMADPGYAGSLLHFADETTRTYALALESLAADLARRVEELERKHEPTVASFGSHGHFIERCSCGVVTAQCRCPSPTKEQRVSKLPCTHGTGQREVTP